MSSVQSPCWWGYIWDITTQVYIGFTIGNTWSWHDLRRMLPFIWVPWRIVTKVTTNLDTKYHFQHQVGMVKKIYIYIDILDQIALLKSWICWYENIGIFNFDPWPIHLFMQNVSLTDHGFFNLQSGVEKESEWFGKPGARDPREVFIRTKVMWKATPTTICVSWSRNSTRKSESYPFFWSASSESKGHTNRTLKKTAVTNTIKSTSLPFFALFPLFFFV